MDTTVGPKSHLNHSNLLPHWSHTYFFTYSSCHFLKAELFLVKAERFYFESRTSYYLIQFIVTARCKFSRNGWVQDNSFIPRTSLPFHEKERSRVCKRSSTSVQSCSPSHMCALFCPLFCNHAHASNISSPMLDGESGFLCVKTNMECRRIFGFVLFF